MIFSVEWEQIALQGKNHGSGGRRHSWHRLEMMCDSQERNKEWAGGEETEEMR